MIRCIALFVLALAMSPPAFASAAPAPAQDVPAYAPIRKVSPEPYPPMDPGPPEETWRRSGVKNPRACVHGQAKSVGLVRRDGWPAGLGTPEDLAAVIDSAMCRQLFEEAWIMGAAVVVVDHGRIAFQNGYGYAVEEKEEKVDPERTLFRLGSISKLFTWTAVMQLTESGRLADPERGVLDLSADINTWLARDDGFRLPDTYPGPITLKNLMTHTSGLEVNFNGYSAAAGPSPDTRKALADTVKNHVPARAHAAPGDFTDGTAAAYANYGAALAGHIVALQSGLPFEDYVERNIFGPLQMKRTTFREPLHKDLLPDLSEAYRRNKPQKKWEKFDFEWYHPIAPAASATGTATDMAHFMIAHLEGGRYGDGDPILNEDTLALMHGRAFSPHPNLNGATLGFQENYFNGRRGLRHGGLTLRFRSELILFPDEHIGIFVVYNTLPLAPQPVNLVQGFMDHYFPARLPALNPAPDSTQRLERYTGTYMSAIHSHATWEKYTILSRAIEVAACNGKLIFADGSGLTPEWVETKKSPGVFRRVDNDDTITFVERDGRMWILSQNPTDPRYRLRFYERSPFNTLFVGLCSLVFLAAISAALFETLLKVGAASSLIARWLGAVIGAVSLGLLTALNEAMKAGEEQLIALPDSLLTAMRLSLVALALTMLLAAVVALRWRRWPRGERLWLGAFTLVALSFLLWLSFWNLLGKHVA